MNARRKRQLEAVGFKVTSVRELLELTDEEAAFIEMKLALADDLKQRRLARKLSQAELSKLLGSSQSRVAKMEAAEESVSIDLLLRSLLAVGATRRDLARIIAAPPTKRAAA